MDVAIVGGTGAEGFGLALRLATADHHVTIGSRVAEKAAASVDEAKGLLGADAPIDGGADAPPDGALAAGPPPARRRTRRPRRSST